TYPVGGKPTNQSPFGVFDMAGNVWEWVGDPYASIQQGNRLLRGGANGFLQNMVYRLQGDPNAPTMIASAGIRCATSKVILVEEVPLAEGVLASDDFADPGSGWPILAEGTFLYGYHPPSFFHVQVNTTDDHIVVSRDPELRDFTVETDVQVSSAETTEGDFRYGLVVRHSGDGQYYAFAISPRTGMWYILKGSPAGPEVLQEGTVETLRGLAPPGFSPDLDQIDTLRVDAQGENFIFHVNGKAVAQLTDADYENGELGFFDENVGETLSHIHYNTFTIREVEFDETTAASLAPTDTPVPPTPTEEAAPTEQASDSDALPTTEPEPTDEPSTPEPEAQATDTPVPTTAPDTKVIDDMVLIPAGYFLMGSQIGPPNERPEHPVLLNAFYLDPFETTNAQYRECIDGDGCTAPNGFPTSSSLANHPVVSVNWDQANAYCQWAGKRLPTEAEWEYAASGPDNLIWPWGNTFDPNLSAASAAGTQPVGSYPEGASPFGVFDMAGNVNEWVADDFQQDSNFYATSPPMNPINDRGGAGRIFRGGSY
ncbi:MAG: formylglycine-generating enzyme family protein, partial [Chloroflexi bacterium]|nr:formylglycine-generating enzyme family protein [Chloroflexota bacterium]